MSHTKVYVCDTWDDLCDIGEHTIDRRCYRSRKDAELRASRLTYDDEEVRNYAKVVELDACWEPDDAERWYAKYVAQWIAWHNLLDENAKLRERVAELEELLPDSGRWYRAETVEAYVAEIAKLRGLLTFYLGCLTNGHVNCDSCAFAEDVCEHGRKVINWARELGIEV